jgi:hypothetical protein
MVVHKTIRCCEDPFAGETMASQTLYLNDKLVENGVLYMAVFRNDGIRTERRVEKLNG